MGRFWLAVALTIGGIGCASDGESPPVPPSKMELIVTDLELSEAYSLAPGRHAPDSFAKVYRVAVLRKHGLSDTAYQEALDWYYQHPALLDSVYTHVKERLEGMDKQTRP